MGIARPRPGRQSHTMTHVQKSVAIIGAGIVGLSTAIWLQRMGHRVTLFDRKGPGAETSFGNAGLLAAMAVVPVPTPGLLRKLPRMVLDRDAPLFLRPAYLPRALPFLLRYLANGRRHRVERIAAALSGLLSDTATQHEALAQGTEAARYIRRGPLLFLYPDKAHYAADSAAWSLRARNGISHQALAPGALADFDPLLAGHGRCGAVVENHGHITDPGAYCRALAGHIEDQGGRLVRMSLDRLPHPGQRLETPAGAMLFDTIVLTAGIWSAGLLGRHHRLRLPIETERGYHIAFKNPSVAPRTPVMVTGGKFVLTPMEGQLRAAGLVEIGGLDAPPTRPPVALLQRQVARLLPDLRHEGITTWMGHRPVIADSLPVIGRLADGVWAGFGHQHVGLTAGPKTGRWLAQLISGQPPNADLSPFAPYRFTR